MSAQRQQVRPRRRFSRKEIAQYFFPRPISAGLYALTTTGAILSLVGLILIFTIGLSYFDLILALIGIIVLFIGASSIRAIVASNPRDRDYDDWLEKQASTMIPIAMRALSLRESHITSQILTMQSIILPGSSEASNYRDNVYLKRGKDGQWRSSVNLFTIFFPTDRFIAMFTRCINALDPVIPFDDTTEEFFYRDIISASFQTFSDVVVIGEQEISYRVQQFSLKISSGDDIRLGAYLSAVPIDRSMGAPIILLPDTDINQTLADFRVLLRVKKQRGR